VKERERKNGAKKQVSRPGTPTRGHSPSRRNVYSRGRSASPGPRRRGSSKSLRDGCGDPGRSYTTSEGSGEVSDSAAMAQQSIKSARANEAALKERGWKCSFGMTQADYAPTPAYDPVIRRERMVRGALGEVLAETRRSLSPEKRTSPSSRDDDNKEGRYFTAKESTTARWSVSPKKRTSAASSKARAVMEDLLFDDESVSPRKRASSASRGSHTGGFFMGEELARGRRSTSPTKRRSTTAKSGFYAGGQSVRVSEARNSASPMKRPSLSRSTDSSYDSEAVRAEIRQHLMDDLRRSISPVRRRGGQPSVSGGTASDEVSTPTTSSDNETGLRRLWNVNEDLADRLASLGCELESERARFLSSLRAARSQLQDSMEWGGNGFGGLHVSGRSASPKRESNSKSGNKGRRGKAILSTKKYRPALMEYSPACSLHAHGLASP
jgi:hypothetical protein